MLFPSDSFVMSPAPRRALTEYGTGQLYIIEEVRAVYKKARETVRPSSRKGKKPIKLKRD
jgi:hypothetical protein